MNPYKPMPAPARGGIYIETHSGTSAVTADELHGLDLPSEAKEQIARAREVARPPLPASIQTTTDSAAGRPARKQRSR